MIFSWSEYIGGSVYYREPGESDDVFRTRIHKHAFGWMMRRVLGDYWK